MKILYTGLESQGKSLLLADKAVEILKRNRFWHKKYGFVRKVVSNLKFSSHVEKDFKQLRFSIHFERLRVKIRIGNNTIITIKKNCNTPDPTRLANSIFRRV